MKRTRSARRPTWRGLAVLVSLTGLEGLAAGDDTPARSDSRPAETAARPAPTAFTEAYERAKEQMRAGQFAAAAAAFSALASASSAAPDGAARARASELAELCGTWARGGYALTWRGSTEEEQERHAAAQDRRTAGEMATLYTAAVLYGVGSGVALAAGTRPSSPAGVILPSLAFAAAAAGGVALLDHRLQLRYGVPQSIVSGLFIGLEEAIAWSTWNQARVSQGEERSDGRIAALYWGTSTLGALGGGVLGTLYGTTPGRASLAGSGALWAGLIAGFTAAALTEDGPEQDDHFMLAAALALNAGGVAGVLAGAATSPSIARVRFLDLGGVAGGLLFGGIYVSVRGNHDRKSSTEAGWAAAGSTLGLAAAWVLTGGMAPDEPRRAPDGVLSSLRPLLAPTSSPRTGAPGLLIGVGGAL